MARQETLLPTRRLRSAARAERSRVLRELDRLERRRDFLAQELIGIEASLTEIREHLKLLNRFAFDADDSPFPTAVQPARCGEDQLHDAPQESTGPSYPPHALLRGAQIRAVAVRLLAGSHDPVGLIHYNDWFELVEREGYRVSGKDPRASFLTQISRSPVVRRESGASGRYALDFEAPRRWSRRVAELKTNLQRLDYGVSLTVGEVTGVGRRRRELIKELARSERALEETLRLLGPDQEKAAS